MGMSALTALCVISIGFGVPAICVYSSIHYGFNFIVAGIISALAVIASGALAFISVVLSPEEAIDEQLKPSEREKLIMMRAHQRATLEELDDIIVILREIRDALKAVQE